MGTHNIHCRRCSGSGKDYENKTCLTCEGTGIEKLTDTQYENMLKMKLVDARDREERQKKFNDEEWIKTKKGLRNLAIGFIIAIIIGTLCYIFAEPPHH